jgi:hypothetical protein
MTPPYFISHYFYSPLTDQCLQMYFLQMSSIRTEFRLKFYYVKVIVPVVMVEMPSRNVTPY